MTERSSVNVNLQGIKQQLPSSVGVPLQVLVLAVVAVIALVVGAFSVAAGFALFVLGLLALVILDFRVTEQEGPSSSDAPASGPYTQGAGASSQGGGGQQQPG
jgi:uncharacterized membrane protein